MKRRMILTLALALVLSLALVAGAQAAGLFGSYLTRAGTVAGPDSALVARDGVTLNFTEEAFGLIGVRWDTPPTTGALCVFGPRGGAGAVIMLATDPVTGDFAPVAVGAFSPTNYAGGGYTVKLFVPTPDGGLSPDVYAGSYEAAAIFNQTGPAIGSFPLTDLSVDAVKAGPCSTQNGQGQNGNGQGQNP